MHAAARCVELVRGCDALDERIGNFQAMQPDVDGLEKLRRAVARERDVAVSLQTASDPLRGVTGLENNLRGFQLELECAKWAPGVTAVRKRFAKRSPSIDAKLEDDEVVEVDVVAQNGALWIECKAEKGRVAAGLVQQLTLLRSAQLAACMAAPLFFYELDERKQVRKTAKRNKRAFWKMDQTASNHEFEI